MYNKQKRHSFRLHQSSRGNTISWVTLGAATIIICTLLSLTTSFWSGFLPLHLSQTHAKAAASSPQQINIPFFKTAVPFNQTAIFWFGDVTPTDTYTDVRIGYNSSELYVDLQTVDQYLWYDTNTTAPDVTKGDNAAIYVNTTTGGSNLLAQHSYKFQAAVNGYKKRTNYQQAYAGSGTAWNAAKVPFTAVYGWRGHGFNGPADSGWSMTYHIPFSSLGMSSAPSQGTIWKLAVKVHNQDNAANTPLPDKWWPTSASETDPSGWGNVSFGMLTYQSPHTNSTSTYTVRNGLNNQVVTDGMVGGSLSCGNLGLNRWTQWGPRSYPGAPQLNIQNELDISDWNCFSKIYITFPLGSLASGQSVVNAKVTLYEYGNSGTQGKPNPSYIQVATVNQNWNPQTLSWNSAPPIQENITSMLVNTKSKPVVPLPGLAVTWDVSLALAQAYAAGQPLQLVFYSTDNQYNTGKYFYSSTVGSYNAAGRPTLQVTLGQ
ncbi:MAG: DNRLRE domain-containing protein [Ktedonobacteraceae bacterium]